MDDTVRHAYIVLNTILSGDQAFASVEYLAEQTGLGYSQLNMVADYLEDLGAAEVLRGDEHLDPSATYRFAAMFIKAGGRRLYQELQEQRAVSRSSERLSHPVSDGSDGVLLEPEEKELLEKLFKARENIPRQQRQDFRYAPAETRVGGALQRTEIERILKQGGTVLFKGQHIRTMEELPSNYDRDVVVHPGLSAGEIPTLQSDLDTLAYHDLIRFREDGRAFYITPKGISLHNREPKPIPLESVPVRQTPTLPSAAVDTNSLPWLSLSDAAFAQDEQIQKLRNDGWEFTAPRPDGVGAKMSEGWRYVIWRTPDGGLARLSNAIPVDTGNVYMMRNVNRSEDSPREDAAPQGVDIGRYAEQVAAAQRPRREKEEAWQRKIEQARELLSRLEDVIVTVAGVISLVTHGRTEAEHDTHLLDVFKMPSSSSSRPLWTENITAFGEACGVYLYAGAEASLWDDDTVSIWVMLGVGGQTFPVPVMFRRVWEASERRPLSAVNAADLASSLSQNMQGNLGALLEAFSAEVQKVQSEAPLTQNARSDQLNNTQVTQDAKDPLIDSGLLTLEDNAEHLRRLVEQVESRAGIVPFVGAGLSMPFRLPGWTAFLQTLAAKADLSEAISERIDAGEYEEAAQDLEDALTSFRLNAAIEADYGNHKLAGQQLADAVMHLPAIAPGPVITTNFDRVLERVFEEAGSPFQLVVAGAKPDLINRMMTRGSRGLLKLHGDWEERTDRVLTKRQYDAHYGESSVRASDPALPLPRLLAHIMTGHSLLFVGCSLNKDRTVLILGEMAQVSPEMVHFAIVEQPPSATAQRDKGRFLSEHNILPIWFPQGRYDLIEPLLALLADRARAANP